MKAKRIIQNLVKPDSTSQKYPSCTEWHNFSRKLHRLDGPAIEYANGYKAWYVNDRLHRLDGPAIECADGGKWWYVDDKYVPVNSQEEFEQWLCDNYEKELLGIKI